ncbi:MAG: hypothetical protein AAFR35_10420 [Pseudomonadota bacterium]
MDVPAYDGRETREFLYTILEPAMSQIEQPGALEAQPGEIADAVVFLSFLWAAVGEFSESRAIFAGQWRRIPAAERVARKIGASRLADKLAETWAEVQTLDPDLLDAHDRRELIWDPAEIAAYDAHKGPKVPRRAIPEAMGERISTLVNYRWQDDIDLLPLDAPVTPEGDGDYRLENAVAAYLSRALGTGHGGGTS